MPDQQIFSHKFDNGLTLVAEEMDWLESAAFSLNLPAGCQWETPEQAGLARLTREMTERGAGSRDSRQFITDLELLGADCSSTTSIAHTSYGGAMPADSLLPVLGMFADLAQRPLLPADQFEDALAGCIQEARSIDDELAQKTMKQLRQRFYGDPFGRDPAGTVESLERLTPRNVETFYRTTFQPRGAILSIAGKINWPQVKDHVAQVFGSWQGDRSATFAETAAARGYHHIAADSSQTHIGVACEGVPYTDANYFQLRGAIGVLSDGMSSRLFTEVREKRGLVYTVHAYCHSHLDRGGVFAYAGTTTERAQETLDVLLAELRRLYAGIEADELQRLKGRIKRAIILQQESSPARTSSMASDWYYFGRVRSLNELNELIDGLTAASINQFLADHPPREFTIVTLGAKPLEVR